MKRLFLAVLFIVGATFTYAAPFGLKMGMTIDEIAEQCEDEGLSQKLYKLQKRPAFIVFTLININNLFISRIVFSFTCHFVRNWISAGAGIFFLFSIVFPVFSVECLFLETPFCFFFISCVLYDSCDFIFSYFSFLGRQSFSIWRFAFFSFFC